MGTNLGYKMILTSAAQFIQILHHVDPIERQRLRDATATEIIWLEIIEKYPEARRSVTLVRNLPKAAIVKLVMDEDPNVRFDMAMKRCLPPESFLLLATDSDDTVRQRVAYNRKTPREILELLSLDKSDLVSSRARAQLNR